MDYKFQAAKEALTLVVNNCIVGLGAGSTMAHLVNCLQEKVNDGLSIRVVTSSFNTRQLLLQKGFTVLDTGNLESIDIYFDGCDQFDANLNALKSGGGIHTMEKLLAS